MTDTRLYYSTAANASSSVPPGLHQYTEKTVPVDADEIPLADSTLGWSYRRLSWANLKTALGLWYDTAARTLTNKTITSPKVNQILDTNGEVSMQFLASAAELEAEVPTTKIGANYFSAFNAAAGVAPVFAVWGTDTNVPLHFRTKGTGGYRFLIGGGGSELASIAPNVTDPVGSMGRLSITNAPGTDSAAAVTLTAHATTAGKLNSNLNLNTEGNGTVFANSVPVVTGNPSGLPLQRLSLWTGTKDQYDAIVTKSQTCIYVVSSVAVATGDIMVDEGAETGDITAEPVAEEPATRSATTKTTRKK